MDDWMDRFGPLGPLLADDSISEIMVNSGSDVFIERYGKLETSAVQLADTGDLQSLMEAIAVSSGRPLDAAHPCLDASLPDGSRVNCVIPPVAVDGPSITIRKFPGGRLDMQQLLNSDALDLKIAQFLVACVRGRTNIVVSGGTGSGKTTLLGVLSDHIPATERVVTIEDTTELRLSSPNLVRLEAVPPTPTDPGVPIRSLVINALRMRPDRIIVGECRGPEAFDMLSAMNTGHEGSLTTVHANNARDCLSRLETMCLLAGTGMPLEVVREKIASSLQLLVHVRRCQDGVRRITEVIEVSWTHGATIASQEVFAWNETGGFTCSGLVPGFWRKFAARGLNVPGEYFSSSYAPPPLGQDP